MKTVQEPTQAYSDVFVFRPYDEGVKGMLLFFFVLIYVFGISMSLYGFSDTTKMAAIFGGVLMFFIQYLILSYFRVTLIFQSGALRVISSRCRNDRCIPAETFSYAYITYQCTTRWNYVLSPKELSFEKVQHLASVNLGLKPRKDSVIVIRTNGSQVEEIETWIRKHIPHVETCAWRGR